MFSRSPARKLTTLTGDAAVAAVFNLKSFFDVLTLTPPMIAHAAPTVYRSTRYPCNPRSLLMTSFYLVVDEIEPVDKFQFRIRMWRQAGFPPLVLYTQIPGQPAPKHFSSYLGNFVLRGFLVYAFPIPVFFELSKARKDTRAFRVLYETIGCELQAASRCQLCRLCAVRHHGVPDTAHSRVSTPTPLFESYVRYLADDGYRVVALRDLARFVDPSVVPSNPWSVIEDRKKLLSSGRYDSNARRSR
jgi:hypothetical protein